LVRLRGVALALPVLVDQSKDGRRISLWVMEQQAIGPFESLSDGASRTARGFQIDRQRAAACDFVTRK